MAPITRDDLQRIFKNLDKDNDGLVSLDELHNLLETVGILTISDELEKLLGQESLNYLLYESMVKDCNDRDLAVAFKVFDLNGDGFITGEELERALSLMGLLKYGQDCKEMIDAYDENSDGVLDFESSRI